MDSSHIYFNIFCNLWAATSLIMITSAILHSVIHLNLCRWHPTSFLQSVPSVNFCFLEREERKYVLGLLFFLACSPLNHWSSGRYPQNSTMPYFTFYTESEGLSFYLTSHQSGKWEMTVPFSKIFASTHSITLKHLQVELTDEFCLLSHLP